VVILQDGDLAKARLPLILRAAGCDVVEVYPNAPLDGLVGPGRTRPDIVLVPVGGGSWISRIRELRSNVALEKVPVLGMMSSAEVALDREAFQGLGVVGLVRRDAHPDHVVFRIDQVVRQAAERRSHERVGTVLAVDVEALGTVTTEFVVSLSARGAGLASSRRLEPNTDVSLTFLDDELGRLGAIQGRVARLVEIRDCLPAHRIGVVFYPLSDEAQNVLDDEVHRLLVPSGL